MVDTTGKLSVQPMLRADLQLAVEWAAQEGWNPGLHDVTPFWAADPGGFLMGSMDGEPVSVISAVRYGVHYGFVGFYIVKPVFRGQGHGWTIWLAAMQRLQGRTVGLDGVVVQQDNYRRFGFELAHRNARYAGQKQAASPPGTQWSNLLVSLAVVPEPELLNYDRRFFPEPRENFLRAWVSQTGTIALGAVADGRLVGYGVLRPCRIGFKVGPLFADSPLVADAIFSGLLQHVPTGQPYYLDVMPTNAHAVEMANRYGMQVVFETARMYLGPAPEISQNRTYGITSFELG